MITAFPTIEASLPWSEVDRSAVLHSYDILDAPKEGDFDDLARVASEICGTPIGIVNLVDTDRQFFMAETGLGVRSVPLENAFCRHALILQDTMVVPDATKDTRFDCNPLVTGAPHLKAYAGALLKTEEGLPIGTICVLDYQTRSFTDYQIEMLQFLARQAMKQLELRRTVASQQKLLARAQSAEREKANFERVVRQASDFIGIADARGRVVFLNDAARKLMGMSERDELRADVTDYIAVEDRDLFCLDVKPRIRAGEGCETELRLRHFGGGTSVPALFNIFPIRDADAVIGFGMVTKDITEQKLEESKRSHMMAEASHRIKNSLSVVQAIVTQTLRTAGSFEDARDRIAHRVSALARAQDVLTAAENSIADIVEVIGNALAPHDSGYGCFRLEGPSADVNAAQALGLSLAMHELATNAVKYGSLSSDEGTVDIRWSVEADGGFALDWTESGGPVVSPPTKTGFGSRLINRMVAPYFEGAVTVDYPPEGLRFNLRGKLPTGQ